jgi:ATP-dependent Lon protease
MRPERLPALPPLLGVLPLRDRVLFPMALSGLVVSDPGAVRLVDDAMRTHRQLAVAAVRNREVQRPGPDDLFRIGCAAVIHQLSRPADTIVRLVIQGLERIRLDSFVQTEPYLVARVSRQAAIEVPGTETETEALVRTLKSLFRQMVELSPDLPDELAAAAEGFEDARDLAYLVAAAMPMEQEARQELLEADATLTLLRRLVELLQHELAVRRMQQQIASQTAEQISKAQREYVLREQMRTLQRELGQEEPGAAEVRELRQRADATHLSPEAQAEMERELARLEQMPIGSPERGMVLTWVEWMVSLPWGKCTGGPIDLGAAMRILDEDHYDLEKVKDRILDHLAVRKLRREREARVSLSSAGDAARAGPVPQIAEDEARREPILCFVGPPGVGKTSLGQSIARAMGRRFVRLSLGGVHDEAEIRGHRRTYIGAMPGRIVQSMRRAETLDPVMMLDEVDKLGVGFHGDPAAALLEVLDPAQHHAFNDTYLGVAFDLSRVLFICTANTVETVPGPLLDRMEVLALSGYTEAEKLHIARRYLIPRQISANGLVDGELEVDDAAIVRIVREYTREAGVRGLERAVATLARKTARRIGDRTAIAVHVDAPAVPDLLGRPRFYDEMAERIDRPGVATGLAWTPAGGDVLFVEAAMMPGQEKLILTGMLGDVMRESAQAAVTFLRSNAKRLGLDPRAFEKQTIHVHVPAGAIPKDGPSAGLAIMAAVASVAASQPVRNDSAMTGEITLRGKVLPVGGIKEKTLAAYRVGVKQVVLPRRNEGDLEDVPREVRAALRFVLADSAEEALSALLGLDVGGERAAAPPPAAASPVH